MLTQLMMWLGFFALAGLFVLLHRKRSASLTIVTPVIWFLVGLAFAGVVYPMYEFGWLGATLHEASDSPGSDASMMFVSTYLVAYAIGFDAPVITFLLCRAHRVPKWHQARLRRWALTGTVALQVVIVVGTASLIRALPWASYVLGVLVLCSAVLALRPYPADSVLEGDHKQQLLWAVLARAKRVKEGQCEDRFWVVQDGRRLLSMAGVCVLSIVLRDVSLALESVAVVSVSKTSFIIVSASILATITQRSWCFAKLENLAFPRKAIVALLALVSAKLLAYDLLLVPPSVWLALTAVLVCLGIVESIRVGRSTLR